MRIGLLVFTLYFAIAGWLAVGEENAAKRKPAAERYLEAAERQMQQSIDEHVADLQARLDEIKESLKRPDKRKPDASKESKTRAELILERESLQAQLDELRKGQVATPPVLSVDLEVGQIGYLPDGGMVRVNRIIDADQVRVNLIETRQPAKTRRKPQSSFTPSPKKFDREVWLKGVDTTKLTEMSEGKITGCFEVVDTTQIGSTGLKKAMHVLVPFDDAQSVGKLPLVVPTKSQAKASAKPTPRAKRP